MEDKESPNKYEGEIKLCTKCKEYKSLEQFSKSKREKDGLNSWCKDCYNLYYRENRKKIIKNSTEWALLNVDKVRKNAETWRNNHPELYNLRINNWRKENPEMVRGQKNRRRARKQGCENPLTHEEWLEILEDYNYICFWCGAPWEEQEHLIPLCKGGSHSKENVVPSCAPCNDKKGIKDPLEFLLSIS